VTKLTCRICHKVWEGSQSPFCPSCVEHDWDNYSGFIQPKHDPRNLPSVYNTYRSVVTMDFITNKQAFIGAIANHGEYFYDTQYCNFTCFINQPLGIISGSAIPANYPWPTHPLDSQKVVSVYNNPHVYAVNLSDIHREVASGRLIPSRFCDMVGCSNLAIPGTTRCSRH
jgi:hypothetical protein